MMVEKKERYFYVDFLRMVMICLVVMIHLNCTYSSLGSWYYFERKEVDDISTMVFAFFGSFTQGYFMGFLFFLAGFFVPGAYDKRGFGGFIKGRLFRLGIPTLIYMLVIHPFMIYFMLGDYYGIEGSFGDYYSEHIFTLDFIGSSGPLWFAFALLIFSIIYALIRKMRKKTIVHQERKLPGVPACIALIVFITTGAFLIRIVQPIGTDLVNMQLCYFTQYIVLFILGAKAYRYRWLDQLTYKRGATWLKVTLFFGTLSWLAVLILGGVLEKGIEPFMGRLTVQSLIFSVWESFVCVGMMIGLLAVAKAKWNQPKRLTKVLSDNSFSVYVFHTPIIVGLSLMMKDVEILPLFKFLLMSIISIPICFAFGHFIIRRIPLLNKVV